MLLSQLLVRLRGKRYVELLRPYDDNLADWIDLDLIESLYFPHMLAPLEWQHIATYHQWLFFNKTFQHWMQDPEDSSQPRLLWVLGAPCSGKTTAISGAYHKLLREQDVVEKRHLVAVFFFQNSHEPLLRSSDGMYRAILSQILQTESWIARSVLKVYGHMAASIQRATSMEKTPKTHQRDRIDFRSILSYALSLSCQRYHRVTIFVDALDECSDYQMIKFDTFFDELLNSDEFRNLRICLSSRNLGAYSWRWLGSSLDSVPENRVDKRQVPEIEVHSENHDAIRMYIDESLQPYRPAIFELVDLKENIVRMSQGIFLWVESMVERLVEDLKDDAGQLRIRQHPVPDELRKAYRDIISSAKDPWKTNRLSHWILLAPDLGLRGWRDLMPFLQDKPPRSLKEARKSMDWAKKSSTTSEDDTWVAELRQIICRVSLGLAQVAPLSTTSLEGPIADYHSAAGEAGSWVTADGNKWVVAFVHDSVRQFLQEDLGFTMFSHDWSGHSKDRYLGESLMTAMMTSLDFINAREFSGLDAVLKARSMSCSTESSDSLLSDGDASARTSITGGSISSAWSFRTRNGPGGTRLYPSETSGGSSNTSEEGSQMHEENANIAVLAHLKEEARRCPVPLQDPDLRVREWLQSSVEVLDNPNPERSSSFEISARSTTVDIWSSELLAYVMTAFPEFCKMAEAAGVDPKPVIIRLQEDGLWARLRCLCEATGKDTSLKHWAESQGLYTWVTYLAYASANPYKSSTTRNSNLLQFAKSEGLDLNLKYCLDGGIHSLPRLEPPGPRPTFSFLVTDANAPEPGFINTEMVEHLDDHLEFQLRNAMFPDRETQLGKFIPYRTLRNILTEEALAVLLQRRSRLHSGKVHQVRQSYIRVLAILLLMGKVPQIEQMLETKMSDACLPIKVNFQGTKSWDSVVLESEVPGKGVFSIKGLEPRHLVEFEHYQWVFLSPFFARPGGHLQHYKLVSEKQRLPVLEVGRRKSPRPGLGYEIQERVEFHPYGFDFEDGKVSDNCVHEILTEY